MLRKSTQNKEIRKKDICVSFWYHLQNWVTGSFKDFLQENSAWFDLLFTTE